MIRANYPPGSLNKATNNATLYFPVSRSVRSTRLMKYHTLQNFRRVKPSVFHESSVRLLDEKYQ